MSRICNLFLALSVAAYGCSATGVRAVVNTSSFGGSVSSFMFPTLAGAKATVSAYVNNTPSILVFDGENVARVIGSSTPVHGYPSGKITGLGASSPSHSKEGIVSFVASVAVGSTTFDAVFVASPDLFNSVAVPVITTQSSSGYTSLDTATVAMAKDGKSILVTFVATTATSKEILKANIDIATGAVGIPQVLVKTGDIIPGSGGLPFLCISTPAISESGGVTFFGSHCGEGASRSPISARLDSRRMYRTRTVGTHCLNLGANRVFPGIFLVDDAGAGIKVVANAATSAPGASNGALFNAFSSPSIGADGTVAFVAETPNGLGIYAKGPGGSTLRLVADTSTTLPSGATFGDFPEPPSVGDGRVAFYAATNGAFSGVYLEAQGVAHTSKTAPVPLLTMADSALGTSIVYIGFGQHSYDEVTGDVAVYLVLGNTAVTDGIYALTEAPMTTVI